MNSIKWFLKDLEDIKPNGVNVFSTFACGGGSTMGYKLAGCNVIGANDIDPEMAWHYKKNLKPKYYFLCPINRLLEQNLPDEIFNLDILDGSPPCSTFSIAGKREKNWNVKKKFREGQSKQILSDLFFDFLNVAEKLQSKVIIAENVKGLILGNAKGYTKQIMKRFDKIGYNVKLFLINAKNCGVPQNRERVFFCAIRKDLKKPPLKLKFNQKIITIGQACNDIQNLTDEEIRDTKPKPLDKILYPLTPKGRSYEKAAFKVSKKKKLWSHVRLNDLNISNTLTVQTNAFKHWKYCRELTYREYKRIGSFPDDYFAKTPKIGKYMVGMSVPPKMIKELVTQIIDQWL